MNVGWGMSQTITVVAAVTVETVVVIGGRIMVDGIVIVGAGIKSVEMVFTIVVEGCIERHEQADDTSGEGNADI